MNLFENDVAVSLVDDAILFATRTSHQPLVLPAYVALQTGTPRVLACGEEARDMMGREPGNITVRRALTGGMLSNPDAAEALFRFGAKKLRTSLSLVRPRVLIAVRSCDAAKRPVKDMAMLGGAREVFLIEMGMATAIGMQLDVQKPELRAALSVSNDWFEFAVISLAGVLAGANGDIGVEAFVEDIQNHLALAHQFRAETAALTAQLLKDGLNPQGVANITGWEGWSGRTEQGRLMAQSVSRDAIAVGMMPSLVRMTERIKTAIRSLPSDKQHQLSRTTIHATGVALQIPGFAQMIADQLGRSVTPFQAETHPSIEGCRALLKELNILRRVRPPVG